LKNPKTKAAFSTPVEVAEEDNRIEADQANINEIKQQVQGVSRERCGQG